MNFRKAFTPKDTEELKPGLFIQKTPKGWKQIFPIVWNGKYRWKEQLSTVFSLRTLFTVALVLFIAWSYTHDVQVYKDFYFETITNPIEFCENIYSNPTEFENPLGNIEVINGEQRLGPASISGYP